MRVVNGTTSAAVDLTTNEQGAFRAEGLAPATYRVEVTLDGFETAVNEVVVTTGQTVQVNAVLAPSRFNQSVVVTARRVEEAAQEVPIPVSVIRGDLVADAGGSWNGYTHLDRTVYQCELPATEVTARWLVTKIRFPSITGEP